MRYIILILCVFPFALFAQQSLALRIDSVPTSGLLLETGWKYKVGDNPDFAKADFDASQWQSIDPTQDIFDVDGIVNADIKWLRYDFELTSNPNELLGLAVSQAGASEVYLNGQLIREFGNFDTDADKVEAYDPLHLVINLPADTAGKYTLAVRYVFQPNIRYTKIFALTRNYFFKATLLPLMPTVEAQREFKVYRIGTEIFILGIAFMLFVLNFVFYIYQQSNKTQIVLTLYLLGIFLIRIFRIIGQNQHSVEDRYFSLNIANWLFGFVVICLTAASHRLAKEPFNKYFYAIVGYQVIYVLAGTSIYGDVQTRLFLINTLFCFIILIRLVRIALKKNMKIFLILGASTFYSVFSLMVYAGSILFLNFSISPQEFMPMKYGISPYLIDTIFNTGAIAIPIALSLIVGIETRETNKELSRQLKENEQLKNKAIEQEREKQDMLATQNETLEKLVNERTAELQASQAQLIQSEKLASLGELTAGIAHEIQNPLNFVNNFSELSVGIAQDLREEMGRIDKDEAYIDELLSDLTQNQEKINHHGKRASSIVKGMLEHSRTSTGERSLTDINLLADEYLRLSYHGLRAKDKSFNSNIKTDFDPNVPKINIIPQDMGRVLLNLVNNAFYTVNEKRLQNPNTAYQPTVTVSSALKDKYIELKVSDNGNGIPDAIKNKIFQPFFTTKSAKDGTGLGLSLSYDIITKGHNGTLNIQSKEGVGTEFSILIPIS